MNEKKIYWSYVKKNKKTIILLSILTSFLSLIMVGFTYCSKLLLDSINETGNKFVMLAIVLGALILIQVGSRLFLNLFFARSACKLENRIKKRTLFNYIDNDYSVLDRKNSADWLNRINSDCRVVADGVITYLPNFISLVIRIVASFIVLLFIDWAFALVLLGLGIIGFFISKILRRHSKELHKNAMKEEGNNLNFYKNTISHSFLIKLFSSKEKIKAQCDLVQDKYIKAKVAFSDFSTFINTGFTLIMRVSYLGAIIYASILIRNSNDTLTYGSLLAMVELISQIEVPFTSLSGLLPKYYQTLGSIERLNEYTVEEKLVENVNKKFTSCIKVDDISYGYKENRTLFNGLSFEINKEDIVLIKGHSGCGKSTLIKLIMGMYPLNSGSITFENQPINDFQSFFSYVPQGNFLIDGSIRDNLLLFTNFEVSDEEIFNALDLVCLTDKIKSLPKQLDNILFEDGKGFSEGEGQRLSIARALLTKRDILVLDEATSALDESTAIKLFDNLKSLHKTIIFVSHKNETTQFVNKIIDLEKYSPKLESEN